MHCTQNIYKRPRTIQRTCCMRFACVMFARNSASIMLHACTMHASTTTQFACLVHARSTCLPKMPHNYCNMHAKCKRAQRHSLNAWRMHEVCHNTHACNMPNKKAMAFPTQCTHKKSKQTGMPKCTQTAQNKTARILHA